MKQKDIAVIIAIAGLSIIIAFVMANYVIAKPDNRKANVQGFDAITSNFTAPDAKYFNPASINPTQTVKIGGNSNPQPFNQ